MQGALNLLTVLYMLFILTLSLSGTAAGALGTALYYIAFILPVLAAFIAKGIKSKSISPKSLLPNKKTLSYTLPFAAPFLAAVMLISFLTSLLLGALGFSDSMDVSGNFFIAVLRHALLPALLEELLFRLLPMEILSGKSKKGALIISALFFALVHMNLFQIPYALAAGFVLSYIALVSGSVFPAILLHFINNLLSIVLMRNPESYILLNTVYISVAVLAAVSVAYLVIRRKKYLADAKEAFFDECKLEFTLPAVLFVLMTLAVSIFNLGGQLG